MMCNQAVAWAAVGSRCEKVSRLPVPLLHSSLVTLQAPGCPTKSVKKTSNIVIQFLSKADILLSAFT